MPENGDFGVMLNGKDGTTQGKLGKWKKTKVSDIPWPDLLSIFGVTKSTEMLLPERDYECPSHVVSLLQEDDLLRSSEQYLKPVPDIHYECDERFRRLEMVMRSCLAAERSDIENRPLGDPPTNSSRHMQLPRALDWRDGPCLYAGYRRDGVNRTVETRVARGLLYDEKKWSIGLSVRFSPFPQEVEWKVRKCIADLKIIQLSRKERDKEQDIDVYGIVTSGDNLQFHKLKDNGELLSSPLFSLTAEGLPAIWPYLRSIVHTIQVKARPPRRRRVEIALWRMEKMVLRYHYKVTPTGEKFENPRKPSKLWKKFRVKHYVFPLDLHGPETEPKLPRLKAPREEAWSSNGPCSSSSESETDSDGNGSSEFELV